MDISIMQRILKFPLRAYVKENGFLALVSYNDETDDFFITTKSDPDGDYAQWAREMFYKVLPKEQTGELKQYVKDNCVTLVFECVDIEHDPHVIDYVGSNLYLLDVVKNSLTFQKIPYEDLCALANQFHLSVKALAYEIGTWQDFIDWYDSVLDPDYQYNGKPIEGFVLEDATGLMVKCKLNYYNFWKFMRGIAHETIKKGYVDPRRTSALITPLANAFYGWIKAYRETHEPEEIPKDICTLRKLFYQSEEGKMFSLE